MLRERLRRAVREVPVTTVAVVASVLLSARLLVMQIASLPLPLHYRDGHNWRQSFTYGVAWNYAHTTLDVLRPRMFVELAKSNVVPMEAPLYPLLASILMRLTGDWVAAPRLLSWLGLVITALVLFSWFDSWAERAGLFIALSLSPMVAVEFRSLQPEPVAAGFAIASAFYFERHARTVATRDLVKGGVLFGLSLLAKPLALGIAPGLVVFSVGTPTTFKETARRALRTGAVLAIALVPWFAWDRWAYHMLMTDLGGEWIIEIGRDGKAILSSILGGAYSQYALLHELPVYASSWWLAPAVVVGLYRGLADRHLRTHAIALAVWLIGYELEMLGVGIRLNSNAYYSILAAAPLAWFAAVGLGSLVRVLDARTSPSVTVFRTGLALIVLLPIGFAFSHASHWNLTSPLSELGFERNRSVWTSELGLARLLFVLIGVLALAPRLRPPRIPPIMGVPIFLAIAALAIRPMRDSAQYFRYYTAANERAGFDADLASLRSTIDKYSRPTDRILVSPGLTYREPPMVYFAYARRNGMPLREAPKAEQLAELRARGARLYLKIDQQPTTHPSVPGRIVATGPWWKLSCVADDGCPPLL